MGSTPSKIFDNLYLGGCDVEEDFFQKHAFTHVLSVCQFTPRGMPTVENHHKIDIDDMPSANLERHFPDIVRFIHGAVTGGGMIYVHCAAGISRSTTSLLSYLMVSTGLDATILLRFLKIKRACVCPNDGFRSQLMNFSSSATKTNLTNELQPSDSIRRIIEQELVAHYGEVPGVTGNLLQAYDDDAYQMATRRA